MKDMVTVINVYISDIQKNIESKCYWMISNLVRSGCDLMHRDEIYKYAFIEK